MQLQQRVASVVAGFTPGRRLQLYLAGVWPSRGRAGGVGRWGHALRRASPQLTACCTCH